MSTQSLPDNFLFSKPPQFQPPLKYWGHLKNFNSDTTNCGVDGKNSPSTPQIVVSMVKIHYRHHNLWCRRWIFVIVTTNCGHEGGFLPSTPQFVVSKVNFCHRHQQNLWCTSRNFLSAPNISTGAEIVGVWKTKSYLEDFKSNIFKSDTAAIYSWFL